jgi:class 3 adenylate cyclase
MALATGGLMLLAVAGVLYLGYSAARESTLELLSDTAKTLIDSMVQVFERELDPIVDQATWIAEEFASGRLDLDDRPRLDAFIRGSLAATPDLMGVAILAADSKEYRYLRRGKGADVRDRSDDEGTREFINSGRAAVGSTWGVPLWVEDIGETIVNLRTPLFRDGRYLGILVQAVSIRDLSLSLVKQSAAEDLIPFVLYARSWVLAHPRLVDAVNVFTENEPLPALAHLGDRVLGEIWGQNKEPLSILRDTSIDGAVVHVDSQDYVLLFRQLRRYADEPLTVGVYFEAGTKGTEQIERLEKTIIFGVAILMLSVIAALAIGHAIGSPILRLSDAAKEVRRGNLDTLSPLPPTRLREIDDASRSFNAMVQGLRERRLVRDLLGKYVPESVAAKLIKERGAIEPLSTQATVMFTDVAGFTTLSEQVSPEELVEMLNEYFTVLADILESHGGVITQFQGDGLLAVFNVPAPDPDHAAEAVRSAVEMQRAVGSRTFAGHTLSSRIGVTTGEVVAGSVGTSGRLSYTIYGDTVNLASRLEQMNKQFGTGILLSQHTVVLAGDFPFQRIGEVEVRGKAEPVTVYTLKAETTVVPPTGSPP